MKPCPQSSAASDAPTAARSSYWLTRFMILRLLGFVYLVAFLVAANQIVPLIGAHGLLPVDAFFERVRGALGSEAAGLARLPTLFWFAHSDATLVAAAWLGAAISAVVLAGCANALMLAALWALYLSFVHAGQDWYGYGWEIQLCETGFLAIFLCPLLDARPFPKRPPPMPVIWLCRWLIARIMLGAGLIKLRGDESWRNLTALYYHFETQPIPGPLSRWFHFLPRVALKAGVVFNFVAELAAPWAVFAPRTWRHVGGAIMVALQVVLILSGNLSFLNWLTLVPALAYFDDSLWAKILPRALVRRAEVAAGGAEPSRAMTRIAWGVAVLVAVLSVQPVVNLLSLRQVMNTSFDPFELVNTYGAFGSVGQQRLNVVFEGTDAATPDGHADWKPYPYVGLPGDVRRRPPQIAPYQPRLDWQMWFAAMSDYRNYPWTLHLVWKLLHNDPGALSLFAANPFPRTPPRYVRAVLYRYRFAPPGNPAGAWWTREELGLWLPPLSTDDRRLQEFLKAYGWLD
ncbi:MAG TPA: lipase maturation factor family protein [Opitutus sp.]|nr:lipase maturation factor family protein [Opitutus sp.]